MPYKPHRSEKLKKRFKDKPWQGADPIGAKYIFVGLDANFAKNVETQIPEIDSYLQDGPRFWRKTGIHHPFLLDAFSGSGKLYHKRFAGIGFQPDEAELVSFVELLHLPTTGTSSLRLSDLSSIQSKEHLCKLANWFDHGSARYIFLVGDRVAQLMRQKPNFPWLPLKPLRMDRDLKVLREQNDQIVYGMYHFSLHYKKQVDVLTRQIARIAELRRLQNG